MKLFTPPNTSSFLGDKNEVLADRSFLEIKPAFLILFGFAIFMANRIDTWPNNFNGSAMSGLFGGYYGNSYSGNQETAGPDYKLSAPMAAPPMMPLSTGNFMFTHVNSDGIERFAIISTVAIVSGTTVTVTDNEWSGAAFNSGDANDEVYIINFTTDAPCGTEYIFTDNIAPTSNNGSGVSINDNSFADLEAGGDALYLFDGLYTAPNFISAISFGQGSWGSNGNLPAGLTNDMTALDFSEDNGEYLCGMGSLASTVMNEAYWTTSNSAFNPHSECYWNCNPSGVVAGDIYFTGGNTDAPDGWSFVIKTPIDSGTVLHITDNEWSGTGFNTGEGTFLITFTSDAPCGTEFAFSVGASPVSNNGSTATITPNTYTFEDNGDALYLFEGSLTGSPGSTDFVSAMKMGGAFGAGGDNLTNTGLTNGTTAIDFANDNGGYNCANGTNLFSDIIMNEADWITSNTVTNVLTSYCTWSSCVGADIGIMKPDGTYCGDMITLTFYVYNLGPDDDPDVNVMDNFPGSFSNIMWSSSLNGVMQSMGSSDINENISLDQGDTIIYRVMAQLPPMTSGTLSNTASVTGSDDFNSANDTDTGNYDEYPHVCNPPLAPLACEDFRIMLVLDASGSIDGGEQQTVRDAAITLVNSLTNTGVSLALVQFAHVGENALIGSSTDYQEITGDPTIPGPPTGYVADFVDYINNNYPDPANVGTFTNWEDGFIAALTLAPANLMLYMTDGDPTAYNCTGLTDPPCTNFNTTYGHGVCYEDDQADCEDAALAAAIVQADIVKSEGTHLYVFAVGGAPDLANITEISGPMEDLCPDTDYGCINQNPTDPHFNMADFTTVSFQELAFDLANFTAQACQSDINIQKTVYFGHDDGAGCPGLDTILGPSGTEITYCFTITNIGNDVLDFTEFDDPQLGINVTNLGMLDGLVDAGPGNWPLSPNEVITYYYETTITDSLCNVATITATGQSSTVDVFDSDQACVEEGGVTQFGVCGTCNVINGPADPVCPGTISVFTASIAGVCGNPVYTWIVIGNIAGFTPSGASVTVTAGSNCNLPYLVTVSIACDSCSQPPPIICFDAVLVQDLMAPALTCPSNTTVQCASQVPAPNPGSVTVTDNCGGTTTVTHVGDVTSGQTCANRFTVTRTYRASDACGNSATCEQIITVFDNTGPGLTCPTNVTVQCANQVPAPAPGSVTATDNCGGSSTVTFAGDVMSNQTCANRFTITRTYQAIDVCGNTATCNQTITVFDNTAPTLTCPPNVTVLCTNQVPIPDILLVTATDNCVGSTTITHTGDAISGQVCPNRLTITRTYQAVDACGNTGTCNQIITVFDNTPPSITCPSNITVECANQVPAPEVGLVTGSNNCGDILLTVTHDGDAITNQTCTNRYILIRTYRATDACGNSATCTQTISVFDTTVPSITCPQNVTVQCANLVPAPDPTSVSSSDNCGGSATVTHLGDVISNQTCANRFNITRTYRAMDACGNSATCTQTISVFDNTAPSITCPANVTVQCASLVPAPAVATVTVSDNCGGTATVTHLGDVTSGQTCTNRFIVIRTYRAIDECGNSATCEQTITVFDNTPPSITCLANVTVQCASLIPAPNPGLITTSTDNCGGTTTITHLGDAISNQTCANRFTVTRTYRAADECGNSASCTQTITVFDNTAPSITCPANITVQCANLVPAPNPALITTSTDNCGGPTTITHVGDAISNQTCANRFTISRTYRATDECGNSASCTQTITVFDNTAPSITCPANVTVQCANLVPAPNPGLITTSTDNCGGTTTITHVGDAISNQTCANRFTVTRTYRASDECGNSASCTQTITVFDNTAPSITCPANVTVQCANLVPAPNPGLITTSTDNCGGTTTITHVGDAISNQTCANRFTIARTYSATDECGNSASCTQTITVFDNTAPSITCPMNVTVQCAEQVPSPAPGSLTATDNCGGTATVTYVGDVVSNQTCAHRFNVTRTYRATDACGNSATCTQTITVYDNTPPVITACPIQESPVQCASDVPPTDDGFLLGDDACGEEGIVIAFEGEVISNMTCANRFTLTRTWSATDVCGNSATCTVTIVVFDDTPPSIVNCPANVTVQCANLVPVPDTTGILSIDNCNGPGTITHVGDVISGQTCVNRYNIARTYRATDECGNSAECTQTITVFDNTAPSISCPANVTVQCASLVPAPNPGSITTSTDNCGGTTTVIHVGDAISNQTCANRFNITRTYSATDDCGNSASCTQTITVFDNTAPSITCPANVTVQCANLVPAPDPGLITTSTDNCGGTTTVTHVGDAMSNQTCANRFTVTRTYQATDECGNSASCTQTITVFDDTPPSITCPQNVTVQCANAVPAPSTTSITTSTDNCGGATTITYVGDVISNQTCTNRFNITRTYRSTDECGNSATCTQTITVFDNTPPALTCPQNVLVQCANQVPAPNPALVTSTDNCGGIATITHVGDVISNQTCANRFNIIRTYQATDECGNSATCTQTISVFDNLPPSLTCPGNVTVQCANLVPAPNPGLITTSTDNCGGTTTITHVGDVISNQTCANRFTVTRTYRATDECGNSASCTQTITVFDNTAPSITCPANVTVQCANLVPAPDPGLITTSTDNCGGTTTVTHVGDVVTNQTCVNRFNLIRTYRSTDECGNSASCTQTITVFDNTGPTFLTCPANITVECANLVPATVDPAQVSATDNCGGTATVTLAGDVISNQTCANRFTVTRTYRATDECGNSASCTQTITVFDSTAPSITCPANVTVQCANLIPAPNPGLITTSTDNCGGTTTITHVGDAISNQTCANRFTVTRTYRATDECGNSASCTQTITVFDSTAPSITCPANVTVQCANLVPAPNPGLITTSTDNCGGTTTITHVGDAISNQTCANRFNITRTYRSTDECGNSASCTQTITVFDNTAPSITCPANVTVQCANLIPAPNPGLITTSTDNCGGTTTITHVGDAISNQTCTNRFNVTRTYRATDDCGNSATCTQTITVFDNTPPSLTCPGNVTVQCASQIPGPNIEQNFTTTDNCGIASVSFDGDVTVNQTCVNRFNVIRTYRATDDCGNSATCTQTIIVFDNTPPSITCPANVTVQCANLVPAPSTTSVTSSDNCGGTTTVTHVGDVISNQTCTNRFNVTRTYLATDACGNSATCDQTITVFDNTAPSITCPVNITVSCTEQIPAPNTALVVSTDNCGGMTTITYVSDSNFGLSCTNRYNVLRTYRATDECGNSATCTQTITVFDNVPPILNCPDNVTVQCITLIPPVNPALVLASDNCSSAITLSHVNDVISGVICLNRFNVIRTYQGTDDCGNSSTCTQSIVVFDNTPPALTCAANVTVQCANLVPAPDPTLVTSTDNCVGGSTVTHIGDAITDQTCSNRFNITRTYRAIDRCGNSATCTQTITVFDNTSPGLTCPANVTVQCANLVPAPNVQLVTSTDNCGGTATVTHVGDAISNQICANRFNITRTYRATDECGNSASCTQTITVFDNTAPSITCPANVTVQCANLVPAPSTTSVTSSDNCGGTTTVTHVGDVISNQTCVNRFSIARTYRATDECGNSASCTQTITVFDNTAPSITCPANVTVQCANLVPAPSTTSVTSSDNCGGTTTVTHVGDVISNQTCVNRFTIARTYRATDECGNSASCTQTITVFDNTAPSITCPANVTVQCASLVPAPNVQLVTSSDNCGGTATVTHVGDAISNQTCVNRFTIARTYRATDECGNSASCTQTITVFDNTAPTLTCPANVTVQCANLVPAPNVQLVTSTDNCGGTATVTHVGDAISNQTCVNRFNITRTYRATDECGNSATCTQTITVFDNTAPSITCPANVTVQCASLVPAPNVQLVTSSDNCGGTATVTHVGDAVSNQTCVNRFNVTRTYRATDECGNSASCTQTITVFDNIPPTVVCPVDITVECANLVPAPNVQLVTSTDNCGGTTTVTHVGDVISNQTCVNRFDIARTYRATDECGNSAMCTQTISVFDDTPPTITCPANITVQCANLVPAPSTTSVTATDNCGGTATVTHVGDAISNQTCVNRFTIARTYRATDECGNSASCTQTITVFDNTAPTLTCPANVTVQCASLVPAPNVQLVTSTDNCGGTATVTHVGDVVSNQTCVNRFNVTRTYRATDECGNSASCTQTITVFDNTAPTLTCPANVTVQCASLVPAPNVQLVTSTDNCGGTATVTHVGDAVSNQTCVNRFNVTRTYRATDECGNSASCTQTITVFDNTAPTLTCPANVTVQCANLIPAPNTALVTATDNCAGTATVTHVGDAVSSQTCVNRFNVTRTYRATDECGNSATCTQTITVFDNTAPSITCPANVTVQCANLVPAPSTTSVTSSDNCGGTATVTHVGDAISNQTCVNRFTIARTYRATDECGNSASCTQTITVFDNTAPSITCPANVTVQCANLVPAPNVQLVTSSDNCGGTATVTHVGDAISNQTCTNRFTISRTYRATDECGNSASCTQTITVFDNTAPTLTCPANVTVQCASLVPATNVQLVTATDNCGGTATVTHVGDAVSNQTCVNRFNVTRTYRATDECGNSASCTQTITVFDNTAPTLTCPANVTVQCASLVPAPNVQLVTATDNCGGTATVTHVGDAVSNQTCVNRFNVTRTYRATDECGNSASCTQTITVFDNTAPTLTCPANVTVQCASLVPAPNVQLVTATDNCAGTATVTHVGDAVSNQTCVNRFNVTRTYRATDECGNSATCTQTITVFDNTVPSITCPANVTVQCANLVPAPSTTSVTSSDNCGGTATVTHVGDAISNQTCVNRFTIARTYRATDECGNSASCTQTITVFDNTAPSITCPANVTVQCANLVPAPNVQLVTSSDNCGGTATVTHVGDAISNQTCVNRFIIARTYRATDECGNSASCTQTITVFDNTAPTLTCPANVTVQCANQVPAPSTTSVTSSDNCGGTATVTHVGDVISNQTCTNRFDVIRTYGATDECGNSATCTQTISVFDNTPPTLTCPENITVQCASQVPTQNVEGITTTDNCGVASVTFGGDVTVNQTCVNRFTLLRTYRATDDCGNTGSCTQTITVFDNTSPTFLTCPANITVQCANLVPATVDPAQVSATDNCGGASTVTLAGDVISNQTCADRFTVTRTYRATDECGNSSSCTQTITVFDNTAPMISACPANVTVQCANLVPAPNPALVTATDNCAGAATTSFAGDAISNQTCANRFTVTRTYRATDACGNSASCTQTITVFDNTAPSITCPVNVTVQCANLVPPVNIAGVTSSDNCGGSNTVTHAGDVITNMTCVNRFIVTRTYRATDACGNSASCTQTITVFDNTAPSITCPANVTVQCASGVPPVNTAGVTSSDNCGGTTSISHLGDVITNMTCVNRFVVRRTYRASDLCGNSATCVQIITVFDNTPPTITFTDPLLLGIPNGGTVEVQCFGQDPEWDLPAFGPGSVSATDNCAGAVTVTFTQVLQDEGNCPVDGYIVLYRLTWTATDVCGNSRTAQVFLALVDEIPPVIHNVPDDITVNCDEIPEPPILIFATDECLCACIILYHQDGPYPGCQDGQVVTRTWTARDDCGNETIETQNITLIDNEGPEIILQVPELMGLPDRSVLDYTCNEGGIPDFYDDLGPQSAFSPVSCGSAGMITFDSKTDIANNCEFWGYIEQRTFHWHAVDLCGNATDLTIIARLIDTEPPVLINVPDMACVDDPLLKDVDALDNCGNPHIRFWDVEIPNPCGTGNEPAFRRTYEAYDDCGNMDRDTTILISDDDTPPVMVFVNPMLAELKLGETLIIECSANNGNYTEFGPEDVSFMDDCPFGVTVTFTETVIELRDCSEGIVAILELKWVGSDICGNETEIVVMANVVDHTSPELVNFDPVITIDCNADLPETEASDNCGVVTITYLDQIIPGPCPYMYDVKRTVTATDPCGNTTIGLQTIHVGDGSGPDIEGVVDEICDDLTIPDVTAFDNCAGEFVEVTMTSDTLDTHCIGGIVIRRTWTAVDICGNVSSVTQDVILGDDTPPLIHVPSNSIILKFLDVPGLHLVLLSQTDIIKLLDDLDDGSVFILDDCDQLIIPEFTLEITNSPNCILDGWYQHRVYTWVATDACGNSSSISFFVNIVADIAPEIFGVPADETIICQDLPAPPIVQATGFAQPITIEFSELIEPGDGPGIFIVTRIWRALDPCGNVRAQTQTILWIPNSLLDCEILLPEMVECNSHGVVIGSNVSGGQGGIDYLWEVTGEKCFIQSGQGTPEITIYVGWSTVQIRLTVTDAFGCSTVCTASLDCVDSALNPLTGLPVGNAETIVLPETSNPSADQTPLATLNRINLWPNPANGTVNLSFEANVSQEVQFTLINFLGQTIINDEIDATKGLNTRKIDVAKIPEGSYLMQVQSESGMYTKIITVMHQ